MSRGGGKDASGLKETVSLEEFRRIDETVRAKSDEWTMRCLSNSFNTLVKTLDGNEKVKKRDTIETLATRLAPMIETICGLYRASEGESKRAEDILDDVVRENNLISKTIATRFEIKLAKIVETSMRKCIEEGRQ